MAGTKTRVGFIGLGAMGSRMAANVLAAGYPLAVYNRTRERTHDLADEDVGRLAAFIDEMSAPCAGA